MKLLKVMWLDAMKWQETFFTESPTMQEDIEKKFKEDYPLQCDVGFLIHENDQGIFLAPNYISDPKEFHLTTFIPHSLIKEEIILDQGGVKDVV